MAMDGQTKALHQCKRILDELADVDGRDAAEAVVMLLQRRYDTRPPVAGQTSDAQ